MTNPPPPEVLEDLLKRVEGADPSNQWILSNIACDIHHELICPTPRGYVRGAASGRYLMFHKKRGFGVISEDVPPYTASLEAALALVERMGLSAKLVLLAAVAEADVYGPGWLANLPRRIISALLRALQQQGEG